MKSAINDILWTLLIAVVAFVLLRVSVATIRVEQQSMEPSIQPGYWIVLNKIGYLFTDPKRGEVIVFHAPPNVDVGKDLIKRIIGLPGDRVEIKNQTVYVNGFALSEPYLANPPHYPMPAVTVPAGEYFVLGDNRDNSVDSHLGWFVPRDSIVGRAWIVIWPAGKWGKAPNHSLPLPAPSKSSIIGIGATPVVGIDLVGPARS